MTEREKLVELINYARDSRTGQELSERIADHLIANGVTVQEWISVKEPPKEDGRYLVLNESEMIFDAEYSDYSGFGYWRMDYDPDTLALVDSEWYGLDDITHWMPLPPAPEDMK